jgi:hypothetical protein
VTSVTSTDASKQLTVLARKYLDQLLRAGEEKNLAELACLGHVSRPRLTQILNLLSLAPDIQEAILHLAPTISGRDTVKERDLRQVVAEADWRKQREVWSTVCGR